MKVKIPFDFDKMAQKELGVELDIPEGVSHDLIRGFFMRMNYSQRQAWIHSNLSDKNVRHISEEEL
tara:strand:- start:21 stop:218 length:198 start_codon:yes stop_codon:yes gene_type:complete